jgi:FdhE protein
MNAWEKRVARARFLAQSFQASREILIFYAGIAEWQGRVAPALAQFSALPAVMPSLVDLIARTAPAPLAEAARAFDLSAAESILRAHWQPSRDVSAHGFFARAALQPYAANLPEGLDCPWCAAPPQVGCLRPQGDGLALELVCALCLRRRAFPRAQCPGCNETSESRIATYATNDFPHLRLLACDACKGYFAIVDLAKDIAAIPEVDELAALPLDLWATQQGFHKLQANLIGV